jgi:3-oxoacyl-[acyl-carrier protein] reductase
VNTVAPGFIPSSGTQTSRTRSGPPTSPRYPPGGWETPADIAHAVGFLAGEDAGFITGQRIIIDGGRSLGS